MVLLDLNSLATPGWVPLLLTGILGLFCVGLAFSMRRHIRKIDVPVDNQRVDSPPFAPPAD